MGGGCGWEGFGGMDGVGVFFELVHYIFSRLVFWVLSIIFGYVWGGYGVGLVGCFSFLIISSLFSYLQTSLFGC